MSHPHCHRCGCSPCNCTTVTETAAVECVDPGLTNEAAYAGVFTEELCSKRLIPFRGLDLDDNQVTDTAEPLQSGVLVQRESGQVQWSNEPLYENPTSVIKVANDTEAANIGNYIPFTLGKTIDFRERKLMGSPDTASGQWKMVWVASVQQWTTVPDITPELPTLCSELVASFTLDPANTDGYLIQLESTEHLSVGVSVMVNGYELMVTEVVDDEFVRVKHMVTPAAPVAINEGEIVCNIGYRPCPQTEEAFADTLPACKDNQVVSLTVPADISGMKAPGFLWRDQLGQWAFLPAPVDGVTGIINPNLFFATPAAPADNVANLPVFRGLPKFNFIAPTTIFSQITAGLATAQTTVVTLSGTAGFVAGATAAIINISIWGILSAGGGIRTYVKINNVTAAVCFLTSAFGADADNNQIMIEVPVSTNVSIEVLPVNAGGVPVGAGSEIIVSVGGYLAL